MRDGHRLEAWLLARPLWIPPSQGGGPLEVDTTEPASPEHHCCHEAKAPPSSFSASFTHLTYKLSTPRSSVKRH